ncbi:MAG TPA: c-type cytochrome [Vicinamibacterales bacterium]|nr:c-type cytochrome [Vicinamibacterales bacterium]
MRTIIFATMLWAVALVSITLSGQGKSVNEGVYTPTQAARGEATFEASCTACHDTSRFSGPDFLSTWTGQPLHVLFDHVHTTMPEDNPGSLKPEQYADVLALFLKLNGYPEGTEELPAEAEALKGIKFDAKVK